MTVKDIRAVLDAQEALGEAWRKSALKKLLIENLSGTMPIVPPPSDEFPRLRCYRGTGYVLRLIKSFHWRKEQQVRLTLRTEYVERSVDRMMESEGCLGAATETVQFDVIMPEMLVENPTKKAFDKWAFAEVDKRRKESLRQIIMEAKAQAERLVKRTPWRVSISSSYDSVEL